MVTLQIRQVLKETPFEAVVELWRSTGNGRHAELQWQEEKR